MARLKKNLFLQGASDMLGKQLVYKTVNGETIVAARPIPRGEGTEAQRKQNLKFKYASIYAKAALEDETLGPIYAEAAARLTQYRSAYQLAVTDYLKSPTIGELVLESGTAGSSLLVEAFEDPQLAKLEVAVLDESESLVTLGDATLTSNGIQWEYVLSQDIPEGGKLEIRAYDLAGNVATKMFDII